MSKIKVKKVLTILVLIVITVISFFPFYMMLIMGTYKNENLADAISMLPGNYLFENMRKVLSGGFMKYYGNSLYITVLGTTLCALVSALTGYGLAKFKFRFNKFLSIFIVVCMMIPYQLGLIGYVIEMRFLHLADTREAVILMNIANCFGAFWMTQYTKSGVHDEVLESARLDGCGELGIFFRIVLPFVKPGLATLVILQFMWNWNAYLLPLVVLNDPGLYTIPLGIASLGNRYSSDFAAQICALSLGTIPLIIIFALGSRYFIKGLTAGSVKG